MYRYAAVVYLICFSLYILFSRQPDYFDAETTPGQVVSTAELAKKELAENRIEPGDHPIVSYKVGKQQYYINGQNNTLLGLSNPQGRVTIIYDPGEPSQAAVYQFFGYWIQLGELLISAAGFAILLFIAVGITGKNSEDADEPVTRKTKYS